MGDFPYFASSSPIMPGVWRDEDLAAFPSCGRPHTQKPALPLADHIVPRVHPGEHIGAGARTTAVPTLPT